MSNQIKYLFLPVFVVVSIANCSAQVQIDHVIITVSDLDSAVNHYKDLGFTIKPGSLHKNGIRNAHIKFKNSSAVELITLEGEPGDDLAKTYSSLLDEGAGGVFIGLTAPDQKVIEDQLKSKAISYNLAPGKLWTYITFNQPELAHFFFIFYHTNIITDEQYTSHSNGVNRIQEVHVEGNDTVSKRLEVMGLKHNEDDQQSFQTATGAIKLLSYSHAHRPRIIVINYCNTAGDECLNIKLD